MTGSVIQRKEMLSASLQLGGTPIALSEYATTGLLAVAVGPRGNGKTNAGLLIAEQLAQQGWVSVLIDPESEMESMYGTAVSDAKELGQLLKSRKQRIVVVRARDAGEFVPYGRAILEAADLYRKPLFVMTDEGQLFSGTRNRKDDAGEAADIINEFAGRGRKRALDLFITALRYTGTLHRLVFSNKNLTLIGCQEDPTAWSALAAQCRAAKLDFADLNALAPGEFFCFARQGVEKIRMPMAKALQAVAPKATPVKRAIPATFAEWDRALQEIPLPRLQALTAPVVNLLGAVAGLTSEQIATGLGALQDELGARR